MKQAANCIPNSQFPRRAEAIIKTFETKEPIRILMTSNTRQGIEIFKQALPKLIPDKNESQTGVRFFRFDKPAIMTRAVAGIQPKLMVLLETELWPGLLQALKTRCCKIIIINGRITEKSLQRYHLCPSVWQTLRPDKILAISSSDADRFRQFFGPDGVEIMANIKFDRIVPSKTSGDDYSRINSILTPGRPFVVLASVRREEEPQVINIIREIFRNRPQTIMGLFPRHMHRLKFWQQTIIQLGIRCALRSTVSNPVSTGTVILWDTFG